MKKYLMILAAASLCLAGCNKEKADGPTPGPESDADYIETTLSCSVNLMEGIETNDYGIGTIVMPGDEILKFFDMTAEEFYHAMGTYEGTAPNTSQKDNTISFGVCTNNNIDLMNFCPSSSNNFGCWMDANSAVTVWGDDAVFYHENLCEWGLETPGEDVLAKMWSFDFGFYPGHNEYKAGDKVKATYFFQKDAEDDDEKDLYCYVEMIFNITQAEEKAITVVGSKNVECTVPFDTEYTHYAIDLPVNDIQSAVGIDAQASSAYAAYPDGTFSAKAGQNYWYAVDGSASSWGADGVALCIVYGEDVNPDFWAFCLYPNDENAGKAVKGSIAFVNAANQAYVVNLTVNIEEIQKVEPVDASLMHDDTIDVSINVNDASGNGVDAVDGESIKAKILDALQVPADKIDAANNAGQLTFSAFVGEEAVDQNAGGFVGNWFAADGSICNWGTKDETTGDELYAYYVEFGSSLVPYCGINAGLKGKLEGVSVNTYSQKVSFTTPDGSKSATVTLKYTVSFAFPAE